MKNIFILFALFLGLSLSAEAQNSLKKNNNLDNSIYNNNENYSPNQRNNRGNGRHGHRPRPGHGHHNGHHNHGHHGHGNHGHGHHAGHGHHGHHAPACGHQGCRPNHCVRVHNNWSPCCQRDFNAMIGAINRANFDSRKLRVAMRMVRNYHFSVIQIRRILGLFCFESNKLAFAKCAYQYTCDRQNYPLLYDCFTFNSSVRELDNYIYGGCGY